MAMRHSANNAREYMGEHLDTVSNVLLGISIVVLLGLGAWFGLQYLRRRSRRS